MSPFALNIVIIVAMFVFGYFIGRERKIAVYDEKLLKLRNESKYWFEISQKQKAKAETQPPPMTLRPKPPQGGQTI